MKAFLITVFAILFALVIAIISALPAHAQGRNCGPRAAVIDRLAEGHGETRQSMGLGSNNVVIEVFASDETGSWTITVTHSNGMTCLVASGQGFERLTEALPPKGEDM